jgi:hypothetical protein
MDWKDLVSIPAGKCGTVHSENLGKSGQCSVWKSAPMREIFADYIVDKGFG